MKLTNKKIFTITLAITAIHFVLSLAIGFYIGIQIHTQTDKIDKEMRAKIFEAPRNYPRKKLEEEVMGLAQKSKEKSEEIYRRWKVPDIVISLPITRFITPLLRDFLKKRQDKVLSNEISGGQFLTEGILILCAANLANSFAFGLLLFPIIMILNHKSRHNKRRRRTKNKPSAV